MRIQHSTNFYVKLLNVLSMIEILFCRAIKLINT